MQFVPIVVMCYYELLLYYFLYVFQLYNYHYFSIFYGYTLMIMNILYPKLIDPKRYLNYKLIASSSLFIFPSFSLWRNGYYFNALLFANALGLSPASDALLPYEDGEKNNFFYYMDVVNDVFVVLVSIMNYTFIKQISGYLKVINYIIIIIPLIYWKFGLQYFEKWDNFHALWHILGASCGVICSEISTNYKI